MTEENTGNTLWSGRFNEPTDAFVQRFTASVTFDRRMARADIEGSIAHATMLHHVGILDDGEVDAICNGLRQIMEDIDGGRFEWSVALEDVHMNIESALTDRIGPAGKKLHTGRSRNDQVATDIRLYLRECVDALTLEIRRLQKGLLDLAEREADTIMPGFTHLQVAQPVTVGHHMMAWFEMIERDYQRLIDCRKRINVMPLGAAALAGTDFPIDRVYTAELLGFDGLCANSLDAVSDRDFAIELVAASAMLMVHLSRWSEELVLWMSAQFRFIDLPDRFCTGSSIMPQKKNPDVPELIRGKSGRVSGNLVALLTLMKGQPLAYNKDNQEDKEPLFDTVDTVSDCIRAMADMVPHVKFDRERTRAAAGEGFSTATDLADYLVRRGLPFRDAHEVVGKLVALAIGEQVALSELPLETMQRHCPIIESDVFTCLTLEGSVASRDHPGGTAPRQVREAILRGRSLINAGA